MSPDRLQLRLTADTTEWEAGIASAIDAVQTLVATIGTASQSAASMRLGTETALLESKQQIDAAWIAGEASRSAASATAASSAAAAWARVNERIASDVVSSLMRKRGGLKAVVQSLSRDAVGEAGRVGVTSVLGGVERGTGLDRINPASALGLGNNADSAAQIAALQANTAALLAASGAHAAGTAATVVNTGATVGASASQAVNSTVTAANTTAHSAGIVAWVSNTVATIGNTIATDAAAIGKFLGFAGGGSPPVGVPSIVGERGPELFVPRGAGTIVPNGAFRASAAGHTFHQHNHFNGAAPPEPDLMAALKSAGRSQLRALARNAR
jgi:hypothetical protein